MSITVFLADDHAVVRDGLKLLIATQADLQVVGEAVNGRDAIEQMTQLCADILIIDIAMPILGGIEAIEQISKFCPNTRSIILSMHSSSEHIFRAFRAGASGYLLKESAGQEVINAIRAVHEGKRYLSQKISDIVLSEYIDWRETSEEENPVAALSEREREILILVVEGKSSIEIGDLLSLSSKTVDTYRSRLMNKLNINNIPELVKFAIQHGLTSLD